MKMFILISIVYLIVPVFGQYTYELEDINPNSSTNGNIIGTNYFADKTMLHYFGSFTWLICASRFGELNVIYNSFKEQGYTIELIGVGKSNESSGLENWTEGNNAPICADNPPYPVWNDWNATQRDLYITDANGNQISHTFTIIITGTCTSGNIMSIWSGDHRTTTDPSKYCPASTIYSW